MGLVRNVVVLMSLALSFSGMAQNAPVRVSQGGRPGEGVETDEHMRARLLGVLFYTRVDVKFEDTPVQDAFKWLSEALDVRILGRFNDDSVGLGIDPKAVISLKATHETALNVLEEICEQCEAYEDCTWQIRKGFVEVSTKERLSVPSARETRTYGIRDLMLEPPRFAVEPDESSPIMGKYGAAYLGRPAPVTLDDYAGQRPASTRRKMPEELAAEIVEGIVEIIEPGMWDYGQESTDDPNTAVGSNAPSGTPTATTRPARSLVGVGKWASIRLWRDQLIVRAPDFMHRQINGYPRPIVPPGVTEEKAADSGSGQKAENPVGSSEPKAK